MGVFNFIKAEVKEFRRFLYQNLYYRQTKSDKELIEKFHEFYYGSQVLFDTKWFGTQVLKCPLDLWVYQEMMNEIRPDVIIETGTEKGGSALFFASMMDLLGKGKIITIDIVKKQRPSHKRITYLTGSSTSPKIVNTVKRLVKNNKKIIVVLDSDHSKKHVLGELEIYSKFVPKGSYMVVEDTNINGHPVLPGLGPGPMEAVDEFLKNNKDFAIDKSREKFFLTMNPRGFLKRIR